MLEALDDALDGDGDGDDDDEGEGGEPVAKLSGVLGAELLGPDGRWSSGTFLTEVFPPCFVSDHACLLACLFAPLRSAVAALPEGPSD